MNSKSKYCNKPTLLLPFFFLFLFFTDCSKEKDFTTNFELLTSTVWYRNQQCGSAVDDKSNFTLFKPEGDCCGEFFGFFSFPWTLKDNGRTLVIDQVDYIVEELTTSTLKLSSLQGCPMAFTARPTIVIAGGVSGLTKSSANLHGCVATNIAVSVSFEYGVSTTYGGTMTLGNLVPEMSFESVACPLAGLSPETIYHYRIKVVNTNGTYFSRDLTFKTFNLETVSDLDGNEYSTLTIGTQIWMAENLKTTRYRNGDPIPNHIDPIKWRNSLTGAYCNYNNDVENANVYGRLYNYYAMNDNRNIAPTGWHVATDQDWENLISATWIDGLYGSGSKIKEYGTSHWISPNSNATNESGFTALPGGSRDSDGLFSNIGYSGWWWSSAENLNEISMWTLSFFNSTPCNATYPKIPDEVLPGMSIRCVKD